MGTDVGALPPGTFLMRLSPALQTLWAQVPQGWSPDDVAVDAQGNLLAAGRVPHAATPDDYSSDLVVVKLSPGGQELWRRVLVASDTAQAWSVAVDAQGNVVVGGHASGVLRFGTASLPQAPDRPLLMKLDASGNLFLTGGHAGSVDTGAGVFGSASSNLYEGLLLRLAP